MRFLNRRSVLNLVCRLHRKSLGVVISNGQQTKLMVQKSIKEEMCLELGSHNGQSLLLCWYFIMSSPEPLLIEKLKLKITIKADRIPSAGYGLIAI